MDHIITIIIAVFTIPVIIIFYLGARVFFKRLGAMFSDHSPNDHDKATRQQVTDAANAAVKRELKTQAERLEVASAK